MNEFLAVFLSILVSFLFGLLAMGLFGGKTTLHYLLVRMGRGKKVLVWADTPLGRKSFVGKLEGDIKEGTVSWTYQKDQKITELKNDGENKTVGRFFAVSYIGVNVESPEKPYNLTKTGEIPQTSIDNKTFGNILKRAITLPTIEEDQQAKLMKIVLVLLVVAVGLMALLFFKVTELSQVVANLGVI